MPLIKSKLCVCENTFCVYTEGYPRFRFPKLEQVEGLKLLRKISGWVNAISNFKINESNACVTSSNFNLKQKSELIDISCY